MPKISLGVPETNESILRPAVFDVARNILKITGLPKDTPIRLPGSTGTVVMPGSQLTPGSENNSFTSSQKLTIEVSEEYSEDATLTTAVFNGDSQLIFLDPKLGVALKPVFTKSTVTLTVNYRSDSRSGAERWRNEIRSRTNMGRVENLHSINYHYPLPPEYLVILHEIHLKRETVAGYGETLKQWFDNCFTPRYTSILDQAGENPVLAIAESQLAIVGWFDFTAQPERGEKSEDGGAWNISFNYTFVFDKPTDVVMRYPMMIHNQLLPVRLRGREVPYRLESTIRSPSYAGLHYGMFAETYPGATFGLDGISVPEYDDWLPKAVPSFTNSVLRLMLKVNPLNLREVMDLTDMGDFSIKSTIAKYMKDNAVWLNTPGEAAILITLFKGDLAVRSGILKVDSNLKVTTTVDLSMREEYHLRVGIVTDLSTLSQRARDALRKDAAAFFDIVYTIDSSLNGKMPTPLSGDYITRKDFDQVLYEISDNGTGRGDWLEKRFLTVGSFIIQAHLGDK